MLNAACAISRAESRASYGTVAASVMRIAYLPSSEQLISPQLSSSGINQSVEFSKEQRSNFDQEAVEFLISNETRRTPGYTGCVGSCVRSTLARVSAGTETEFHSASLNIGWKRRGTLRRRIHPPRVFCFTADAGSSTGGSGSRRRKLPPGGSRGTYATKRSTAI